MFFIQSGITSSTRAKGSDLLGDGNTTMLRLRRMQRSTGLWEFAGKEQDATCPRCYLANKWEYPMIVMFDYVTSIGEQYLVFRILIKHCKVQYTDFIASNCRILYM